MRWSTWRNFAVLSAMAALSWWVARDRSEPGSTPLDRLDTRLNYALWNFNAQLLDENGVQKLQIEAHILRNYANSQVGTVENPRIRIQLEDDEWYISADSAIITADREHISLVGTVDLLRQNSISNNSLEIRTRDVMLNVTPRTASTDAYVTIAQNSDHLEAVGMKLDMKKNSYELLDKVRALYATP
jgi:LPS export ABC transporter protein LptC